MPIIYAHKLMKRLANIRKEEFEIDALFKTSIQKS